jgi:hypothetical protein
MTPRGRIQGEYNAVLNLAPARSCGSVESSAQRMNQKSAGDGFFVPGKREEEALGCGSLFCVCTSIMNTLEQENALSQQVS